jgi:hypothetical protein
VRPTKLNFESRKAVTEAERGPEYREDTLAAGQRGGACLEQAFLNPVASVTLIPRHEQGLISLDRERARLGEKALRQFRRQSG